MASLMIVLMVSLNAGDFIEVMRLAAQTSPAGVRAKARLTAEAHLRVDQLIAALKDPDDAVRMSAAWALRFCGEDRAKVLAPLKAALRDENFGVGRAAAVSLKDFKDIAGPLADLLADADPAIRWRGVVNVPYMGVPGLEEPLMKVAVGDSVDYVRHDAIAALSHSPHPEQVAPALVKCLADASPRCREKALTVLREGYMKAMTAEGSPARSAAISALLELLSSAKDKPYAASTAAGLLTELVTKPLGTDADKWRQLFKNAGAAVEGQK